MDVAINITAGQQSSTAQGCTCIIIARHLISSQILLPCKSSQRALYLGQWVEALSQKHPVVEAVPSLSTPTLDIPLRLHILVVFQHRPYKLVSCGFLGAIHQDYPNVYPDSPVHSANKCQCIARNSNHHDIHFCNSVFIENRSHLKTWNLPSRG